MLVTLGYVALIIGIVLAVCSYFEPRTLRPGIACIVLAVILLVLGYLLPSLTTHHYDDTPQATAALL